MQHSHSSGSEAAGPVDPAGDSHRHVQNFSPRDASLPTEPDPVRWAGLAECVVLKIRPRTVLNVGSGSEFLVAAFRDRGIDAFGIYPSESAVPQVRQDLDPYCGVGSALDPLPQRYDVIICLGGLEEVSRDRTEQALRNLCQHADDILIASASCDFDKASPLLGPSIDSWAEIFARYGFYRDLDSDATFFSQHVVRFRRATTPISCVVRAYERKLSSQLQELHARRTLESALTEEKRRLEAQLRHVTGEKQRLTEFLAAIQNSVAWRLVGKLRQVKSKLAPPHTRRERFIQRLLAILNIWLTESTRAPVRQSIEQMLQMESVEEPAPESPPPPKIFKEHVLAHALLDGLTGLEIGAAAHNPFGLRTRNVALPEDYEFYAEQQRREMGVDPAPVDIWASADKIPVPDASEDFIISSHVVEHLPNVIATFMEWNRIVKDGGYVFMIVPLKGALPADEPRELTPLAHFVEDYRLALTVDTHPIEGVPGEKMGHYHTFTPDALMEVVEWMQTNQLCDWKLVAREDVDSKVGNGFTLVFRVSHRKSPGDLAPSRR